LEPSRDQPHVPGPSLWPVGFALGIAALLIGLVVSWVIIVLGAVVAAVFGFLWVRDVAAGRQLTQAPEVEAEGRDGKPAASGAPVAATPRYSRAVFLEGSTIGVSAAIGALITLPVLGFMIGPAFTDQGEPDADVGPLANFREGEFVVTTFKTRPARGDVSRQTAFIRNNGFLNKQPSLTVISNHCAHLGCPVQPNGELKRDQAKDVDGVSLVPTLPSGFGCPCHGGQYDTEGNRTAGPPVRALDRFSYSIRNGNLFIGKAFSVSHVEGTGADAKIYKYPFSFPGEHVDGIESWMYPIQPPH
jgi:quinol---cytochrome c reductase iron-sulfur subunit, bacillus type